MQKFLLYIVCAVCPLLLSWKEPDYRQTCDFVYEHLDEHAKAGLNSLLGKRTLAYYATHMGHAAKDSIENYAGPLNKLELGGPYRYSELDSALRPLNLQILRGIKKYNQELLNTNLPQNRRMFALQVLIGLHTAMQLPLQGVTHLLPRSELLAHDIFENVETPKYGKVSLITLLLYDSYKLGVRVRQADGDGRIIQSFMETGYRNAGRMLAGSIKEAFAPKGLVEMGEGPDWENLLNPAKIPYTCLQQRQVSRVAIRLLTGSCLRIFITPTRNGERAYKEEPIYRLL